MRIAMLGTRGVPASYSGFETCVESVGKRLAARGHQVQVYCRAGRTSARLSSYLGMELITLPSIHTKGLETLTHTALSSLHAIAVRRPDSAIIMGVGNAIFGRGLRAAGIPVAINVDGADWARGKWGGTGRRFLRWSEREAPRACNAVIADSHAVQDYYAATYHTETVYIPYGADIPDENGAETLRRFGLEDRGYFLAVGRMVPENGFHRLIEAYRRSGSPMPFVIVGDAPYSETYKARLRSSAPPSVIFTGYQFGAAYHELSAHAFAFLFGAQVGGTHPVLVEQLAHGNCIIALKTESNAEVIGDAGVLVEDIEGELPEAIRSMSSNPASAQPFRDRARRRATAYSWDAVTDGYERLLEAIVAPRTKRHARRPTP